MFGTHSVPVRSLFDQDAHSNVTRGIALGQLEVAGRRADFLRRRFPIAPQRTREVYRNAKLARVYRTDFKLSGEPGGSHAVDGPDGVTAHVEGCGQAHRRFRRSIDNLCAQWIEVASLSQRYEGFGPPTYLCGSGGRSQNPGLGTSHAGRTWGPSQIDPSKMDLSERRKRGCGRDRCPLLCRPGYTWFSARRDDRIHNTGLSLRDRNVPSRPEPNSTKLKCAPTGRASSPLPKEAFNGRFYL